MFRPALCSLYLLCSQEKEREKLIPLFSFSLQHSLYFLRALIFLIMTNLSGFKPLFFPESFLYFMYIQFISIYKNELYSQLEFFSGECTLYCFVQIRFTKE